MRRQAIIQQWRIGVMKYSRTANWFSMKVPSATGGRHGGGAAAGASFSGIAAV